MIISTNVNVTPRAFSFPRRRHQWPPRNYYYRVELTTSHPGPIYRSEWITGHPKPINYRVELTTGHPDPINHRVERKETPEKRPPQQCGTYFPYVIPPTQLNGEPGSQLANSRSRPAAICHRVEGRELNSPPRAPTRGEIAHQVRPLPSGRHPKPSETAHDVILAA